MLFLFFGGGVVGGSPGKKKRKSCLQRSARMCHFCPPLHTNARKRPAFHPSPRRLPPSAGIGDVPSGSPGWEVDGVSPYPPSNAPPPILHCLHLSLSWRGLPLKPELRQTRRPRRAAARFFCLSNPTSSPHAPSRPEPWPSPHTAGAQGSPAPAGTVPRHTPGLPSLSRALPKTPS